MTEGRFPSQAQIARAVRAAEKAGMKVGGYRVEPNGALTIFAYEAPPLAVKSRVQDNEPNDFD